MGRWRFDIVRIDLAKDDPGYLVEGGFFGMDAAMDALREWRQRFPSFQFRIKRSRRY